MQKIIAMIFVSALVAGCARPPSNAVPSRSTAGAGQGWLSAAPGVPLRAEVQVKSSEFDLNATVIGIERRHGSNNFNTYYLMSLVPKSGGPTVHQLRVTDFYDGSWKFWSSAADEKARLLNVQSIDRTVIGCSSYSGCSYSETFGAVISEAALLEGAAEGYRVRFKAKRGSELIITVTPEQIAAQRAAIARLRANSPPTI